MKKVWNMEWNGMEDFEGYEIWKISIPFQSIACLVFGTKHPLHLFSLFHIWASREIQCLMV